MDDSDALLSALKKGSTAAFEKVLTAYERKIFSHLLRMTGSVHDAEDLTQETFLKVYKHRKDIDPGGNFRSWLYTIATNTARDWFRRRKGKETLVLEEGDFDETILNFPTYSIKEEHFDILSALERIRPAYRNILLLFYADGFSYEELAMLLGTPLNTVKTHLHRAKAELKKQLGEGYK